MNEPRKPRPIREHLRQRLPRIGAMVVALVVATAAMFLARQCSHRGDSPFRSGLPAKSGGDTLDVAIEISPLSYSLARDTISGLDYDILRAFSVQTRRPVKFHPFAPMDYALDGLRAGVFDVVVSSLPSTSSLKQELLLTDRVYLDRQVLVQRRHDPHFIREAHALAGDSVWIAAGSPLRDRPAPSSTKASPGASPPPTPSSTSPRPSASPSSRPGPSLPPTLPSAAPSTPSSPLSATHPATAHSLTDTSNEAAVFGAKIWLCWNN